jgi:hypothetical protein
MAGGSHLATGPFTSFHTFHFHKCCKVTIFALNVPLAFKDIIKKNFFYTYPHVDPIFFAISGILHFFIHV